MTKKLIARLEWTSKIQQKQALSFINMKDNELAKFFEEMENSAYPNVPSFLYAYETYQKKLWLCERTLDTHGVECVRLSERDKRHNYTGAASGIIAAEYLNTGEMYTPTLVYRFDIVKRWDILCVGDLIEILERKGYRLA